jgi:hypothetical protein
MLTLQIKGLDCGSVLPNGNANGANTVGAIEHCLMC